MISHKRLHQPQKIKTYFRECAGRGDIMPELPDVEVFKQYFDATSLHQAITAVHTDKIENMLAGVSRSGMIKKLENRKFTGTRRHGKYLFAATDENQWLMLHFGMTGFLTYFKKTGQKLDHIRLQIDFETQYALAVGSQRRLGRIGIIDDPGAFIRREKLGPDARNDLSSESFEEIIQQGRGKIKSLLMNQHKIAGIGNVYSDEILFQCALHPCTEIKKIRKNSEKKECLDHAISEVLEKSITVRASPEDMPDHFLLPHRKKGGRCPVCSKEVSREKCAGRTSYFCSNCQKS
jgi:formamidopyrimidine-DNA glycosylase